jgi:hypothetical protein
MGFSRPRDSPCFFNTEHASGKYVILAIEPRFRDWDVTFNWCQIHEKLKTRLYSQSDVLSRRVYYLNAPYEEIMLLLMDAIRGELPMVLCWFQINCPSNARGISFVYINAANRHAIRPEGCYLLWSIYYKLLAFCSLLNLGFFIQ